MYTRSGPIPALQAVIVQSQKLSFAESCVNVTSTVFGIELAHASVRARTGFSSGVSDGSAVTSGVTTPRWKFSETVS